MSKEKWTETIKIMERERIGTSPEQGYKEGYAILDRLNEYNLKHNEQLLFKVNNGTLEIIIHDPNKNYVDYDFMGYGRMVNDKTLVDTGFYFKQRCKRNDTRIGTRKLYKSNKGLYFLESARKCYLSEYIKL